jgi:hypothetical protein
MKGPAGATQGFQAMIAGKMAGSEGAAGALMSGVDPLQQQVLMKAIQEAQGVVGTPNDKKGNQMWDRKSISESLLKQLGAANMDDDQLKVKIEEIGKDSRKVMQSIITEMVGGSGINTENIAMFKALFSAMFGKNLEGGIVGIEQTYKEIMDPNWKGTYEGRKETLGKTASEKDIDSTKDIYKKFGQNVDKFGMAVNNFVKATDIGTYQNIKEEIDTAIAMEATNKTSWLKIKSEELRFETLKNVGPNASAEVRESILNKMDFSMQASQEWEKHISGLKKELTQEFIVKFDATAGLAKLISAHVESSSPNLGKTNTVSGVNIKAIGK